jgi:hypothetical protein
MRLLAFFFSTVIGILFGSINGEPFRFISEPIDVVIPSCEKDLDTLELCIEGVKKNCQNIRRIIVVSKKKLSKSAEWFSEDSFPFNKNDVALHIFNGDAERAKVYANSPDSRVGWYYQQLLKLYAPFVIPEISSNVLIVDSDTVFLRPVSFIDETTGGGLYNPSGEYHMPYFWHAKRLSGGTINRLYPEFSGISHHMLFQRDVLRNLFEEIESLHKITFWKAFCKAVDIGEIHTSGASEYEIYFNYVFSKSKAVSIRILKWENVNSIDLINQCRNTGYHYVSSHAHARN